MSASDSTPPRAAVRGARQGAAYLVFGVVNTALSWVIFAILDHGLGVQYVIANVITFLIAVVTGFTMQRRWVFTEDSGSLGATFLRYLAVNTASYLWLGTLILMFFVEVVHLPHSPAQICSTFVGAAITFVVHKFFTFGRRTPATPVAPAAEAD